MKILRNIFSFFVIAILFSACQKEYSIEHGNTQVTVGNWEFSNGSVKYSGDMDTVYQTRAGSINELLLIGKTKDGSQSFEMHLYADSFKIGTYKASAFQSAFAYTSSSGKAVYQAAQLLGEFTVNITTINDQSIQGNFSGNAKDSTGNIIQLTDGKFKASFSTSTINPASSGVLGDSSGNCKPVIIFGNYAAGIPVNNTNGVQIQVTVAVPGAYTITTNTVNGISFSKSGIFQFTGPQNVLLTATGTPTTPGKNNFILNYGNSQCAFALNILGDATGTLGSGGGNCTSFILAGTYQQGIALNTGNTVQIQVNISTPGVYHIKSDIANGISFSGTGILVTPGLQTVTLTGIGTPLNQGLQNFTVNYGTSTCGFPITFLPPVGPSDDYFPLTLNSNWTYDLNTGSSVDQINFKVINYSPTYGGESYQTIRQTQTQSNAVVDSFNYRKTGGDYYEYINFSKYFGFDNYVGSEFIFLKDNVGSTQTWNSPVIKGTISGVADSGYIEMTILAKGVPVSLSGYNFPDVIKVQYKYFISVNPNPVLIQERWFAKNTGEIYFSSVNGTNSLIYQISSNPPYQIF